MNNAWEVYFQRKLDFSLDIQRLDITRLKLSTQSMLLLVPKIIGLLKHGGICPQKQCLSTLPDNPGDTRFWTVSPTLQVRVSNPPENRRILPFLVESTFQQWNFQYFALSYFCTVDIESFLVISGMPLYYKQACGWWEVNRSSQMLCNINFCAFSVIANSGRSASTVSLAQITSCAICYDIIYHPFAINSQYLKTWGG